MPKKIHLSSEIENEIKKHIQQSKSLKSTAKAFNLSEHLIQRVTGWTRKDYLDHIETIRLPENEKKKRKYLYSLKFLARPEVKERTKKRQNAWRKLHPLKRMAWNANLIDRNDYQLTFLDVYKQAKKQKCICAISGKKLTTENVSLDHIIPIAKGGKNTPDNIQLIDYRINLMKRELEMSKFLEWIQLISDYQNKNRGISPPALN